MPSYICEAFISMIKAAPTPQAFTAAVGVFAAAAIIWRLIDGFQFSATFRPIRQSGVKRPRRKHKPKNLIIGCAPSDGQEIATRARTVNREKS